MLRKQQAGLMTLKDLLIKVDKSEISSVASIISKILKTINNPNSSAQELRDIIEVDPPLCAKILKRANSAYYAVPKAISSIQQAIVFLGFSVIKELAMSLATSGFFKGNSEIGSYSRSKLWLHSLGVAMTAKQIYQSEFSENGDDIYAAGLLHDIGIIIEEQFLKDSFADVLLGFGGGSHDALTLYESKLFGYNHCDIGRRLTMNWNLPGEFVSAVTYHHRPSAVKPEHALAAKTLFIAECFCRRNEIGWSDSTKIDEDLLDKTLESINLNKKAIELIMEDILEELDRLKSAGELFA